MCMLSACTPTNQDLNQKIQYYESKAAEEREKNNYDEAEFNWEKALELSNKEYGEKSLRSAEIYLKFAKANDTYEEAMYNTKQAEKIYRESNNSSGLIETYIIYALVHSRNDEFCLAEESYKTSLELCNESQEDTSEQKFRIYTYLIGLEGTTSEAALNYALEAEKLLNNFPENEKNKKATNVYNNIGISYYKMKQYKDAVGYFERAIDSWEMSKEKEELGIAKCFDRCGYSYAAIGNHKKAIEYINKSLDIMESLEDVILFDEAVVYRHLSVVYMAEEIKDYKKAMEYGIQSCEIYEAQEKLTSEELEEFKLLRNGLKELYEDTPFAEEYDFESWYKEQLCNR